MAGIFQKQLAEHLHHGAPLDVAQKLLFTARSSATTTASVQATEDFVKPHVKGNIALVAVIAPILLLLIGVGIWWWRRYRGREKSDESNTGQLPRIAPEVTALPEERELQKRGMDIGGRWGPSFRWWWAKRARARGELSTTEADNGSQRSLPISDRGDDLEMNNMSRDTTKAGSSKASSSRREEEIAGHEGAKQTVTTRAGPKQHPLSRESSLSSLESKPEPVRDVLWWEGVDFDEED